MNSAAAKVLEDVRRLPPGELDWLIGQLLNGSDGSADAEIDASWKAEVERCVAESEAEKSATHSWEEVEAPLHARLSR
jgi:putative addiction module component (TIGR02574 family)